LEDVSIKVTYSVYGYGYYPFETFRYILETGAGWKDAIGSADITVQLPYPVSQKNIRAGAEWSHSTYPQPTFNGYEAHWHFDNLEPTAINDIEFTIVTPSLWKQVLNESANVTLNPNDGEAWGRLAKAYKESALMPKRYIRRDPGGSELFGLSKQAYEKCLALLPNDSLWHYGAMPTFSGRITFGRFS
jgi:hypothetical protein